jgi:Flp pilus assembly protein TadD
MPEQPQPYVGPRAFKPEDAPFFFGREREGNELLSLVISHAEVLLYAQSGAGKTSLINAKLLFLLENEDLDVLPLATMRAPPSTLPQSQIANIYVFNTLVSWTKGAAAPEKLAKMTLREFLEQREQPMDKEGLPTPCVAIFDQFEELFTSYREHWEQRRGFFEQVRDALDANPRLRTLFAMREDYVAAIDRYAHIMPEEFRIRFHLENLREPRALDAIKGPLTRDERHHFAQGVAEKLVKELMKAQVETASGQTESITGEFVEPIMLQVVCERLWRDLKPEETEITFARLETISVEKALLGFYEESIQAVALETGITEGTLRSWFEKHLVTPAGTRGMVFRGETETEGLRNDAVDALDKLHLIRSELRGGAQWYELTHDRFIEAIQRSNEVWFEQWAVSEALLRKLEKKAETPGALLNESETRDAEAFLASPDTRVLGPLPQVESLVRASRLQLQKEGRQRRIKLTLAWSTIAVLFGAFIWARIEWKRASNAEQRAIEQKKIAEEQKTIAEVQKKIAQAETLRTRKQNFEDNNIIQIMADRLLGLSAPEEALFWQGIKAGALSRIGMDEDSINEYDLILQLDPQNLGARFGRGSVYYTQNVEKARQDTEAFLAKVPTSWRAHQNLGISLGFQGQYAEADKAVRNSIRQFQLTGADLTEFHVAPDITRATTRTILSADEKAAPTANYYELANLKAYAGSEEFDAVLAEADKQPNRADAALFALNWAWLQMDKRKEDYGALVAQGALWERLGFKEWAKEYYQRFERTHKETKDKRYEGLARWAARQLAQLKGVGPALEEKPSVDMLVRESRELSARNKLDDALARINSAIDAAGDNVMLYLYRADILCRQGRYSECMSDCDRILLKAPNTALAYRYRAIAMFLDGTPEGAETAVRTALEYRPNDGLSMWMLSEALYDRAKKKGFETSGRELNDALDLLERSARTGNLDFDSLPDIYYEIAQVHRARGDFGKAIESLKTAIAIKDNDPRFYALWRDTQKQRGNNAAQASCSLADVHNGTAQTKLRSGHSGKALDFYWQGLEALTADEKQIHEGEVKHAITTTMKEISQIIEDAGSRAKAIEFWQSIAKLENMKVLWDGAKDELKRLARPP